MKSLKSQNLILIFIIATISLLSPCHCDEQLIEKTCKKTSHYDLCVQSLKSDPSSSNADVAGLAIIMVNVMKPKMVAIRDKIDQLLKGGQLDPKQEKVLRSCDESYKWVMDSLFPTIKKWIELGDPKFAEEAAVEIGLDAKDCEEDFPSGTSPLTIENQDMRDLADVDDGIIKLLL